MPYIPLYPQPLNHWFFPSIWAPNHPHTASACFSASSGPRMITALDNSRTQPLQPSFRSFMSSSSLNNSLPYHVSCDKKPEDVFGPVMANCPRASSPRISAIKKDVGAIGDRRKISDAQGGIGDEREFAVDQLLRNLNLTPLPTEILHHPRANRAQFSLDESPSASSHSSSPSIVDILQTPSDSSPVTPKSPRSFDVYNDRTSLNADGAKLNSIYASEKYRNVQQLPKMNTVNHSVSAMFRGLTPGPLNATPMSSAQHVSVTSRGHPFHTNSFPFNDKDAPSFGMHQASFSDTSPLVPYKGDFNPFGADVSPRSPALFQNGFLKPNDSIESVSSWSQINQSQGSSYTYDNVIGEPQSPLVSGIHPRTAETSSPAFLGLVQRRPSPRPSLSEDTVPPGLATRPGNQALFNQQYHQVPLPRSFGVSANFGTCDALHGLGITGAATSSGEPDKFRFGPVDDRSLGPSPVYSVTNSVPYTYGPTPEKQQVNEPINFLHLLSPTAAPPYSHFITRIVKSSDQQASIFLQQKLKIADGTERRKIIDAVSQRGVEMMTNRFGNWAVQRCLEPPCEAGDRMKIVNCMRGRVVELATNCYGTHVLQKALDCEEEVRLLVVSELLLGDPASTLLNKHSAHVWSKIMELTWTPPAPPIFSYVNKALAGKWASLACHETGSLVVQTAFEQCEDVDKELIINELLDGEAFSEVVTNAWGAFCIIHLLEHGSPAHRSRAIDNLVNGLSQYASHEQSIKSVLKALKEGGPEVLDRIVTKLCDAPKGGRRASLVDIALSPIGSQLIGTILPNVNKEQRSALYEAIRGHVVTLRGSRVGSKVIWLFDRMRAYYGY